MGQSGGIHPSAAGKRRSRRFPFISPVEATWQEADGKIVREAGRATEVNTEGGLLEMKTCPSVGTHIELTNLLSRASLHARVVGLRRDSVGRALGVAVELLVPSDDFWGVNFQLKKTCADLVQLEYDMRSGKTDQHVLREFRDAVDNVRKMAWAVQEWQERELRKLDPQSVLPLVEAERVRRATQLCEAISAAVAGSAITSQTVGLDEFARAAERVHQNMQDLLKDRKA